ADDTSYVPTRATIGSIGIIRQALDHARDVDEAVEIFEQYNISFNGGPPIHYLLADRNGTTVLIEFYKGDMVVLPNESPWHAATNHVRCIAEGDGGCWRYQLLSLQLTQLNGLLDQSSAMKLLSEVKQENTQWSSVYNMTSGEIQVVINRSYQIKYTFQIPLINP
ncbi:MAG TPA: carcinine hydrolase/isopenicillin-N N-acyltransferase family protein, partial [Anaerolineales bacterium]|nr:carcinine hydrolase/isopenicillin-N N-acyltransferase family protein [Anaerolineales bacterium]